MKSRNPREVQSKQKDLHALETRLQSVYQPVRPRSEYVRNLQYQLGRQLELEETSGERGVWRIMLIAASLLSGTFVIVIAVRGILNFLGNMHQLGSQVEPEQIAPVNPAA